MSPETAQAIFFNLYNALIENNFQDVGSYLIARSIGDNNIVYYEDTFTALEQLYQRAQNVEFALRALQELLYAAREYFTTANNLPVLYQEEIQELQPNNTAVYSPIILSLDTGEYIDLREELNKPEIGQLLQLINMTAEFLGNNDEDFFNNLNNNL